MPLLGGLVSSFDQLYLEIQLIAEFVHNIFFFIKTKEQKSLISTVSRDGAWRLTSDLPVTMDWSGELDSWSPSSDTTCSPYLGAVELSLCHVPAPAMPSPELPFATGFDCLSPV